MNKLQFWFSKSFAGYLWEQFWIRFYFKYVLPRIREVELDGVRLDVSELPPKARNRLLRGGYEKHEKEMCLAFLEPDDSVLELGGAIGFLGLFCRKKIGIRHFVSLEANPRTVELLKRNYRLNGFEPVVWNLAVADGDGTVELEVGSDFWENSIVPHSHDDGQGKKTMDVPAAQFETLFRQLEHPANVLIIDIEGAEQFLRPEQVPDSIEKIIIEFHPKIVGAERMYELIAGLIFRGFRVAREREGTFVFLRPQRRVERGERPAGRVSDHWNAGRAAPAGVGQ